MESKLIAGDLWIPFGAGRTADQLDKLVEETAPLIANLIDRLLLYDTIVIPTHEFLIIPLLLKVLGERQVRDLMAMESLRFARPDSVLGYAGNGVGLMSYTILGPDGASTTPISASPSDATEMSLRIVPGLSDLGTASMLTDYAERFTRVFPASSVAQAVIRDTHLDLCNSPAIVSEFGLTGLNMQRLPGIEANQTRMGVRDLQSGVEIDAIDAVLQLAETNLELQLIAHSDASAASTRRTIGPALAAKEDRFKKAMGIQTAIVQLRQLYDIPSCGRAICQGELALQDLLKLRDSKSGHQFRRWLRDNRSNDPTEIVKNWVALLHESPTMDRLRARVVRFLITTAASAIPFVGPIASAADTFLLDYLFKRNNPRFFIDSLQQLGKRFPEKITEDEKQAPRV